MLGKSENYVLVSWQYNPAMSFAGTREPLAYLELKSLNLPEDRTEEFSRGLCEWLGENLAIPAQRIYIEFTNGSRHLWGWNGGTF